MSERVHRSQSTGIVPHYDLFLSDQIHRTGRESIKSIAALKHQQKSIVSLDLDNIYKSIKEDCFNNEEKKVYIFVSALEVDSVCALRILQGILKNDGIHHSIYPVTCYSQVIKVCKEQFNDEEMRNIILINLGACEDATHLLDCGHNTRLLIIDSRRPINHMLAGTPREQAIMICDDEDRGNQAVPPPDGYSDEDASDAEDFEDDSNKENIPDAKRRRSESGPPGGEAAEPPGLSRKERRRRRKQNIRRRRKEYYELGAFWGKPAALTLLRFAYHLHQADKHSYWLGAVALTDQLVHQRIAPEKYTAHAMELQTEIEMDSGPEAQEEVRIRIETADGEIITTTAKNPLTRVTAEKDFRFALMRHWSLYDSMLHSTHVAIRMQTWADKGRRKLDELLTKMGFKVKECQLDFSEMRILIHQQLEPKLEEYGHTAQLSDVTFQSFRLHWGYRTPLSATDAVYAVSSLMESHATKPNEQLDSSDTFWRAWKSLNPGNTEDMRHGLELAKQLQRAILTDGGLIVSRQDVRSNCSRFCWVDLTKSAITNKSLLSQPMALIKLGIFLRDQRVWKHPRKDSQAIIIFGPVTSEHKCLVVSVSRQPSITQAEGNNFPIIFREAAQAAHCKIDYDGFDTCVGMITIESAERLVNEMAIASSRHV